MWRQTHSRIDMPSGGNCKTYRMSSLFVADVNALAAPNQMRFTLEVDNGASVLFDLGSVGQWS